MDKFRHALEECSLDDLGYSGDRFTWRNNNHISDSYIRERLDRAVADIDWRMRFPSAHVRNGEPHHSDHRPVIVTLENKVVSRRMTGTPPFRFEASWVQEENCETIVRNAWNLSMDVRDRKIMSAIKDVAADLWDWSRNILGDLEKRMKHIKKLLEECRRGEVTQQNVTREHILMYKLEKLEDQKDLYWRQRAKAHQLKNGDRNTRFFHEYASERRRINKIRKLIKEDGGVVEEPREILELVTNFYNNLFQSHAGNRYNELLQQVPTRVTAGMNEMLIEEYSDEEIKQALDSMADLKAPGPDGMPALFYKKFWEITGKDVVREVKALLNGGDMPQGWNETVVVLIPKAPNPDKLKDLRPISLCNVIYKIASKVLSNRLKLVIPDVISLNQSAFVPGRLITDDVLLAYELTHYMQQKRTGLEGFAALKLDMSKAYDRVEWDFLRRMMCKLGFHSDWVDVVMKLVSTVSYRVRVNGELTDQIIPQRGLRQGDPLSPYLFLICDEAFSCLLNAAEDRGEMVGV
jgi:hypothetical protein